MITEVALALVNLVLVGMIIRLQHQLELARYQAQRERQVAEVYQVLCREQQEMAHLWMERALGRDVCDGIPEVFRDAIKHALEGQE